MKKTKELTRKETNKRLCVNQIKTKGCQNIIRWLIPLSNYLFVNVLKRCKIHVIK